MQQKLPESDLAAKRQLFWSRPALRRRELLSSTENTSVSALPALRVFVAQNTNLNSSSPPSWAPFTPYSTCTFQQLKSLACLVVFKDIQRPNADLPAQLVVTLTPSVVVIGAPPLPSVSRSNLGSDCMSLAVFKHGYKCAKVMRRNGRSHMRRHML